MTNNEFDEHMKALGKECDKLVEGFESQMYESVMGFHNDADRFTANLNSIWWKGFVAYEAMFVMTIEFAKKHIEMAGVKKDGKVSYENKFFAIMNIHGRACQIYNEILCLLKSGYTDGAFARWRSLFELSVYAMFIRKENNEVAVAYMAQANTDEKFIEWAKSADCLKNHKGNVTFKTIFDNCAFPNETKDCWQGQYELACKVVHASPQGTMKRMGIIEPFNAMLVTGTDWGLHTPAEHAAISFFYISKEFFAEPSSLYGTTAIILLEKWVDVVRRYLYETVGTCFPDIKKAEEIYKKYLVRQKSTNDSSVDT